MLIDVEVKTKQRESKVEVMDEGTYKVSVRALPTKNQANLEVIDLLAGHFNVPKTKIRIKSGKYSALKRIYIDDQLSF